MNFVRTSELLVRKHTACNNFLSLPVLKLPVKKSFLSNQINIFYDLNDKTKDREKKIRQYLAGPDVFILFCELYVFYL